MYKLTMPEISRLYRGFRSTKEKEEAAQRQEQASAQGNHVPRSPPSQPRDSDIEAMEQFKSTNLQN